MKTKIRKVIASGNKNITFTIKSNAINIFEEPQNNLWTFDLEGRLVGMYVNNRNYRRTLDNRFFLKSRFTIENEEFRQVDKIPSGDVLPLLNKAITIIKKHGNSLPIKFTEPLSKILKMDMSALQKSALDFSGIYLPISILPPDQYMSLVIQLTEGCNYNQCTFCNFYRDRPFKIKSTIELENHLIQVKHFIGDGIKLRKSIFLADANALIVPQNRLVTSLEHIIIQFPMFKNIYSFIDVFTGIKKTEKDFKQLNKLGVTRVYLGVESGNSDLMLFLNKKQLNTDIIELTHYIKKAGINVGIIFLVGAGGEKYALRHLQDSIKLIKQLPLSKGDIIYLSKLYETNDVYADSMLKSEIDLPTKIQIRRWSNEFKHEIKKYIPKEVQVAVYNINQFFY